MDDSTGLPHRCPRCHALVVDRRSPVCTTCRAALPADWIMTPAQAAKLKAIDQDARAVHAQELKILDPRSDPNMPAVIRFLDTPWGM
jgi:hypothetical protein